MGSKRFIIPFIVCICLFASLFYKWFNNRDTMYQNIVDSDGKGYYAYLPAIFIYHDLSFNFYFERKNQKIKRYFNERFIIPQNGKTILKTYCGESVLLFPFFITGCIIQYFISGNVTGYEPLMQFRGPWPS